MDQPEFDDFGHEAHVQRAIELAREAADRGDRPFGSVLVRDDSILMEESNRVNTADDIRRHPESHLAHRACRTLEPAERRATVTYTSTEPCPMCLGGMLTAGFGRVVYSVDSTEITEFTGGDPTVSAAEILEGVSEVVGPVLNDDGRAVQQEFDW